MSVEKSTEAAKVGRKEGRVYLDAISSGFAIPSQDTSCSGTAVFYLRTVQMGSERILKRCSAGYPLSSYHGSIALHDDTSDLEAKS